MSKKIQIPECMNPFVITVNNQMYSYPAGTTQEVPDDVAAVIEHHFGHKNDQHGGNVYNQSMNIQPDLSVTDKTDLRYVGGVLREEALPENVPFVKSAKAGQVIQAKSVDENGNPTDWEAVDLPTDVLLFTKQTLTEDQKAQARKNIGATPESHASSNNDYGAGNGTNYGHVKLSDATNGTSNVNCGVAATPAAVKAAYDLANGKAAASHNQAASTITAGTFAGQVGANSSGQAPGTSLLRNSKLVSAETNPTVNGEICWTYE